VPQNLVNTRGQLLGAGDSDAAALTFTILPDAVDAWVNGTFAVTVCTTVGDY
jgi:hypothetical protein